MHHSQSSIKDSFTVSITGIKKSYQWVVSNKVYSSIKIVSIAILLGIFALIGCSYYLYADLARTNQQLTSSLSNREEKIDAQKQVENRLRLQLENEQKHAQRQQQQWDEKQQQFMQVFAAINGVNVNIEATPLRKEKIFSPVFLSPAEKKLMFKMIPNGYPIKRKTRISSHYGRRLHPIRKKWHHHNGTDFTASIGVPLYTTADGVVKYLGNQNGFGKTLIIRHKYGFESLFAHLSEAKVRKGEIVSAGQIVALSGESGQVTAPHLHYEILFNRKHLDPRYFVKWNEDNYTSIFKKIKSVPWQFLTHLIKIQHIKEKVSSQTEELSVEKLN